jgi:hypothetical protein
MAIVNLDFVIAERNYAPQKIADYWQKQIARLSLYASICPSRRTTPYG